MSPRPDIRLIATDMDGTLVDDAKQIHDELWPLIDELHARGITFCPASGRQYYNLVQEFEGVADELVFIAENGTYVVAHGREISSDCLALDVAQQVVSRVRGIPEAGAVLCGKRSAYIERRDPPVRRPGHALLREAAGRRRPAGGHRRRRAEGRRSTTSPRPSATRRPGWPSSPGVTRSWCPGPTGSTS